jgi:hypothetical protein
MNQESGNIKQLKLRIPMELFVQLEQDAELHSEKPATRARHILSDALMKVKPNPERVKELKAANWAKIKGGK